MKQEYRVLSRVALGYLRSIMVKPRLGETKTGKYLLGSPFFNATVLVARWKRNELNFFFSSGI